MDLRRRHVLAAAGAFGLGLHRAAGAKEPDAPVARVDPVTDTYFGTKVTDPYRWMENPHDPDWLPFLRGQAAHARKVLDAIPVRARLARRIAAVSGEATVTRRVQLAGRRVFFEQRPASGENFRLLVREGEGAPRVLIDPTAMREGTAHVSLDWWQASPDGEHVAYGLSPAGSEASVLHVMEVGSGKVGPERIDKTDGAQPSWLPDGSAFFYTQFTGTRGAPDYYLNGQARLHRLGEDAAKDPVVLRRGLVPGITIETNQVPGVMVLPGTGLALALVGDIRPEQAVWTAPLDQVLAGRPDWRPLCGFADEVTHVAPLGEELFLISNKGAPRGRLLRLPAARPELAAATEIVGQGPLVLDGLDATRSTLLLTEMDGGIERLARVDRDGTRRPVALPFDGSVGEVFASPLHEEAFVELGGWFHPRAVWRLDAGGGLADSKLAPPSPIDTSAYVAHEMRVPVRDGTLVPVSVLARKDTAFDASAPCLVHGYGAYQLSITPSFQAAALAFLDEGGVLAVAHVRGGGEFGREWHQAGQKATKPNTWHDMIDVSEQLISRKITRHGRIAGIGTSAGGITIGRAITERPDLFAAAISDVGWSNPLRYVAEQNGFGEEEEWGAISNPDGFRWLLAMDSYQAVRDGTPYPAVLCITGATDPRVAPWHVAKFAARLQAATSSGKPVLLRVDFDAGHGIGSTRSQRDALAADEYAFVLWQTGTIKEG